MLVNKVSPAFELRNSGVPAVVRSFQLPIIAWVLNEHARVFLGCRLVTAYHWNTSAATSPGLYFKGIIAGINSRRCARGTADSPPRLALAHDRRLYLPTQGS
jgi:hypothetical protein